MPNDFDSPWKEAISLYFQDFLEFFFADISADIDWTIAPEFLESELQALGREAKHGRRHADSLVRVHRLSGETQLVFVHIEVQSQVDPRFTARMLLYHTRILDLLGESVCSLAILGDTQTSWRPTSHHNSVWDCKLGLEFPMRKLLDYRDWASGAQNPFAWLTAAHLQAQATRRLPRQRAEIKFRLIRGLYHCGLGLAQVRSLFRLLDWILALSKDLEYAFRQELARFEKENDMPKIHTIESMARDEGRQEGRQEAQLEAQEELRGVIVGYYRERFGELDPMTQKRLEAVKNHGRLLQLFAALMTADSGDEWRVSLTRK